MVAGWTGAVLTIDGAGSDSTIAEAEVTTIEAVSGELGRSIRLPATVSTRFAALPNPVIDGIVTGTPLDESLSPVTSGDPVLVVDYVPVFGIQSATPFARELTIGLRGPDVAAWQRFLDLPTVDGDFGATTATATRRWQEEQGLEQTGSVEVGRIIALPDRDVLVAAADIAVGSSAIAGEPFARTALGQPTVEIPLNEQQLDVVTAGQAVTLHVDDAMTAEGSIREVLRRQGSTQGEPEALIAGVDVAEVEVLPTTVDGIVIEAVVEVVPTTTGTIIPTAAISTDAAGRATVELAPGERTRVDVVVSDGAQAVVDGVAPGQRLVIRAEAG